VVAGLELEQRACIVQLAMVVGILRLSTTTQVSRCSRLKMKHGGLRFPIALRFHVLVFVD
jgi:hypothetical protein